MNEMESNLILSKKDFDIFDNIYRIKTSSTRHLFISPLENPFIQHFLYDSYIKEGHGNTGNIVTENFIKLIEIFMNKNQGLDENENKKLVHLKNLFKKLISYNLIQDIDKKIEYVSTQNDILILGGWSDINGGHAITIRIIKKNSTNYDLFIFNSGEGVERHNNNIGIKIKDVNFEQIRELLKIIHFCKYNPNEKYKYLESIKRLNETFGFTDLNMDFEDNNLEKYHFINSYIRNIHSISNIKNTHLKQRNFFEFFLKLIYSLILYSKGVLNESDELNNIFKSNFIFDFKNKIQKILTERLLDYQHNQIIDYLKNNIGKIIQYKYIFYLKETNIEISTNLENINKNLSALLNFYTKIMGVNPPESIRIIDNKQLTQFIDFSKKNLEQLINNELFRNISSINLREDNTNDFDKIITNNNELISHLDLIEKVTNNITNIYITEDYRNSYDKYFYDKLELIFKDNEKKEIFNDLLQMSGSCTFFCIFYFVKYYFLTNLNETIYMNFYTFLKNNTLYYLIDFLTICKNNLKNGNYNILHNSYNLNLFINTFYILLKDNRLEDLYKNKIINLINDIYSNKQIVNIDKTKYITIQSKDYLTNAMNYFFRNYNIIKNKYLKILNNNISLLRENVDYFVDPTNNTNVIIINLDEIIIMEHISFILNKASKSVQEQKLELCYNIYLIDIFNILLNISKNYKYVITYERNYIFEKTDFESNPINNTNFYNFYIEKYSSHIYFKNINIVEKYGIIKNILLYLLLKSNNKKNNINNLQNFNNRNNNYIIEKYDIDDENLKYILDYYFLNSIYKNNNNNTKNILFYIFYNININEYYELILNNVELLKIKNKIISTNEKISNLNISNIFDVLLNNKLTSSRNQTMNKILENKEKHLKKKSEIFHITNLTNLNLIFQNWDVLFNFSKDFNIMIQIIKNNSLSKHLNFINNITGLSCDKYFYLIGSNIVLNRYYNLFNIPEEKNINNEFNSYKKKLVQPYVFVPTPINEEENLYGSPKKNNSPSNIATSLAEPRNFARNGANASVAPGNGASASVAPRNGANAFVAPRNGDNASVAPRNGANASVAPRNGANASVAPRNVEKKISAYNIYFSLKNDETHLINNNIHYNFMKMDNINLFFDKIKNINPDLIINFCNNTNKNNYIILLILYNFYNKNELNKEENINKINKLDLQKYLNNNFYEINDFLKSEIQQNSTELEALFIYSNNNPINILEVLKESYNSYVIKDSLNYNQKNDENSIFVKDYVMLQHKYNIRQFDAKILSHYTSLNLLNYIFIKNDLLEEREREEREVIYINKINNKTIKYNLYLYSYKNSSNNTIYNLSYKLNNQVYNLVKQINNTLIVNILNTYEYNNIFFYNERLNEYLYFNIKYPEYVFLYNKTKNEDFLIDVVNNETYLILNRENIINYKLLNMYYNNNDNIFVLKNIKTNNFKIILFISNIYIKTNIDIIYNYSNEQINFIYGSKLTQQMYTMLKHIDYQSNILLLSLDNSLLTIKTNNIDELSMYMISVGLNNNYLQLYNNINLYYNLLNDNNLLNRDVITPYNYIDLNIFFIKNNIYNIPLWSYIQNNYLSYDENYKRQDFLNKDSMITRLNNSDVTLVEIDRNIYDIHNKLYMFFESLKNTNLSAIKSLNILASIDNELKNFYKKVNLYCKKNLLQRYNFNNNEFLDLYKSSVLNDLLNNFNIIYQNNTVNSIFTHYQNKRITTIYERNKETGNLYNLNNIILKNRKDLYNIMYIKNVINILNDIYNLLYVKKSNNSLERTFNENCLAFAEIYKSLDLNIINSFNSILTEERAINSRNLENNFAPGTGASASLPNSTLVKEKEIYEILFELESGYYIRKDQSNFIKDIYTNINQNNYEIAYQLLMGMGKTTTITPLIILNEYFNKRSNYKGFIILLPEHLVNSSFNILNSYIKYFDRNYIINKNIKDNLNKNELYIISDTNIKIKFLEFIQNKTNPVSLLINQFIGTDKLVLMDEIDSMIDPLKSNLNMSQNTKRTHKYCNEIFNTLYTILVKKEIKQTLNFNALSTNIINKIKNQTNISPQWKIKFKTKITEILEIISKWSLNKEYGFISIDNVNLSDYKKDLNYFTCIPFEKINKPNKGSKFTEFELYLGITILGYIKIWNKDSIRPLDLQMLILKIFSILDKYKDINYNIVIQLFLPAFYNIFKDDISSIITTYNKNSTFITNKEYLIFLINKHKEVLHINIYDLLYEYFYNVIIPIFFNIDNEHINISFIDVLGFFKNKIIFSGTPYFNIPLEITLNMFNNNFNIEIFNKQTYGGMNRPSSSAAMSYGSSSSAMNYGSSSSAMNNGSSSAAGAGNGVINNYNKINVGNLSLTENNYEYQNNNSIINKRMALNVKNNVLNNVPLERYQKIIKKENKKLKIELNQANINKINSYKKIYNILNNSKKVTLNNNKNIGENGVVRNVFTTNLVGENGTILKKHTYLKNVINNKTKLNDIMNVKNNYITNLINKIVIDNYSKGAIKSSFLGLLIDKKPEITYYDESKLPIELNDLYEFRLNINENIYEQKLTKINEYKFLHYLFNQKNILNYESLIDVGGIILETPKDTIIDILFDIFDGKRKILFVNENNNKMVKINKNIIIPYNNEIYSQNELFIYYDQKNSIGIDFKQPILLHGLVTISLDNKLTDVAQGIFRLRKINVTHSIDFYLNNSDYNKLITNVTINENSNNLLLLKLYKLIKKNGDIYIENTSNLMKLQILKYLNRRVKNDKKLFKEKIDYLIEFKNNDKLQNELLVDECKNDFNIDEINISFAEKEFLQSIQYENESDMNQQLNLQKSESIQKVQDENRESYTKNNFTFLLSKNITNKDFLNGNLSFLQQLQNKLIEKSHNYNTMNNDLLKWYIKDLCVGIDGREPEDKFNKRNIFNEKLLDHNLYFSNGLVTNINLNKLHPLQIYYINYNNYEKNIFIDINELYNIISKYLIVKKSINNGTNLRNIEEYFNKLKIYDSCGDCVFNTDKIKRNGTNNYDVNDNILIKIKNNGSITPNNILFTKLLYLIIFYKKYENINELYNLLITIEANDRNKINILMNNFYKYYNNLIHYNLDFSKNNNFNLEDDNKLLDFFKFNRVIETNKPLIIKYIRTGLFNRS